MEMDRMKVTAADGVSLYAERRGLETDPCIVFSCAYTTTHANWRGQVDALTAAGWQVVLWDHRGHGLSEAPTDPAAYSMDLVTQDLGAICDWASPDRPVVLAGLSFGGLASLHWALRAPERVRALVLAGSGPGFKDPKAADRWAQQTERTAGYLEGRGLKAFVEGRAGATCIGRAPELPAAIEAAHAIESQDVAALAAFGRHVTGLAPSVIDELAGIAAPALVIVGSEDEAFRRAGEVMAAKLPAAVHRVVDGAGHILNIEEAEVFNREVVDFLSRLAPLGP
jgi:pimeloyl-ACP methyl ester carboxylesterase